MLSSNPRFSDAVAAAVAEIEAHSDAEIVVVARADRHAWSDVAWKAAALGAACTLAFLAWSPFPFNAWTWPLEVATLGALTGWLCAGRPWAVRAFTSASRRRERAQEAAAAAFVTEAVHGTRRRSGLLVYIGELEREVVVLPDLGVAGRIPGAALIDVRWDATSLDAFLGGLRDLGAVLQRHLPPVEENDDEIANRPRVLH
jgi:uncharacterized membrane protein